jgi:hypothetical protein
VSVRAGRTDEPLGGAVPTRHKGIAGIVTVVAVGVLSAPVVFATNWYAGTTKYCSGSTPLQYVRSRTSGPTNVYPAPDGYGFYNDAVITTHQTNAINNGGGSWVATGSGTYVASGTYAGCQVN